MQIPQTTTEYYSQQQQIAAATTASANKLWGRVGDNFDASYAQIREPLLQVVQTGRAATVATSIAYTPALLAETGQAAPAVGLIQPAAFLATAPDGRTVGGLVDGALYKAKTAVGAGASSLEARTLAGSWLSTMLLTLLADTGRSVVSADIGQRKALTGYTRMVNPGACRDCMILAGKWFRWNQGFLRHPHCYCRHIPAKNEAYAKAEGFSTDPYELFKSMSPSEQERRFGRSEAQAIREGADIYRVVNLKNRGLATVKGASRYGTPSRMTVDDIFRTAGTRTRAIRMLAEEGYITGPQIGGGNILGRYYEGAGALGKGGRARAATDAVNAARASGVRDPLNRYTQTAAERRLYDAKVNLDVARTGVMPRSVGANSADVKLGLKPITPTQLAQIERAFAAELAKIPTASRSVQDLARALGLY